MATGIYVQLVAGKLGCFPAGSSARAAPFLMPIQSHTCFSGIFWVFQLWIYRHGSPWLQEKMGGKSAGLKGRAAHRRG